MAQNDRVQLGVHDALLAKLRAARQSIDDSISAVEVNRAETALFGAQRTVGNTDLGTRGAGERFFESGDRSPESAELRQKLQGRGTYQATVFLLKYMQRPMTNDELREQLVAAGANYTITSLYGAVRHRKHCEIKKIGCGRWALVE
jgi:hypothetical protein